MQTFLWIVGLWIIPGATTVALVSLAARHLEHQTLDMLEILLSFLFWPYFLIALIVRLNKGDK